MQIEGLDEIDNRILEVIRDNARLTYKEIGERTGISRVSAKTRMEVLQEKGIIRGFQTLIDPTKVPGGTKFFLDIECVCPENAGSTQSALPPISATLNILRIPSIGASAVCAEWDAILCCLP